MLKKLRLRAAILLTIKAYDLITTGEFEKIMTGLTIFRYALVIGPNCFDGEGCDINGCRLIGLAADRIAEYDSALENIKAVYNLASGSEKSLLQDVIALFDPAYGNFSNLRNHIAQKQKRNPRSDAIDAIRYAWTLIPPKKRITDFERCADTAELADTLRCIDDNGYEMSGVTQDSSGVYTVFFRRSVSE